MVIHYLSPAVADMTCLHSTIIVHYCHAVCVSFTLCALEGINAKYTYNDLYSLYIGYTIDA